MRLKNIKGAKEAINNSDYVIKNPEEYKGKYQQLFNNNNPIYLEIGMGKGKFIIDNALKYPNINFIGIEKFDSVLLRACQKLEEKDIPNLKLIRFDATEIENIFDKEIDRIYLNFSDPWPKARHEDRRLTSKRFLNRYLKICRNNEIIIKTDNKDLFEFSKESLKEFGYQILEIDENLDSLNNENIMTEYEEKFVAKGLNIYKIYAIYKNK